MNEDNLPMELKNRQLAVTQRTNKRTIEGIKRVGKILLSAGVATSGLAITALGGPVASAIGFGVYLGGAVNAGVDLIYKKVDPNSMFVQRKLANGEIKISQSLKDIKSFQKMKGFNNYEKGAMMGLELLVELQSIKQQLEDKGVATEQARDEVGDVYPQVYSTITHGVNIDTIEALEKLGYLQIERKEPNGKSRLFFEKLGFRRFKDAMKSLVSKDESKKVEMYDIALKVTDKAIDFEEIYKSYLELKGTKDKSKKIISIKRIGVILEALRNKNIDIVKNEIGETIIDYKAQESFAKRIKREQTNSSADYRKANNIEDFPEQDSEPTTKSIRNNAIKEAENQYSEMEH